MYLEFIYIMSFQTTIIAGKTNHIDKDFMAIAKDLLDDNSGIVNNTDFTVTQTTVVGMSVAVTSGTIYAYISSTSSYYRSFLSDASTTLTIGANASGSTRIDLVCVKTDLTATPDANGGGIATLVIVAGTAGAGIPATPANHFKLAEVTVASGAGTIINANITDKRAGIRPNIQLKKNRYITSTASSATPTPNADTDEEYEVTALAAGATFGAPTGTPKDGQTLIIRVKDNGTARALAFNAIYRFSTDLTAPTTTVISKTIYIGFMYNSADTKWDCLAVLNNF